MHLIGLAILLATAAAAVLLAARRPGQPATPTADAGDVCRTSDLAEALRWARAHGPHVYAIGDPDVAKAVSYIDRRTCDRLAIPGDVVAAAGVEFEVAFIAGCCQDPEPA